MVDFAWDIVIALQNNSEVMSANGTKLTQCGHSMKEVVIVNTSEISFHCGFC